MIVLVLRCSRYMGRVFSGEIGLFYEIYFKLYIIIVYYNLKIVSNWVFRTKIVWFVLLLYIIGT